MFGILGPKMVRTPGTLRHLDVLVGRIDSGGSTGAELYANLGSEELFAVLSGTVRLELGDDVYELEAGDSIGYRSSSAPCVQRGDGIAEMV